MKLLAVTQRVAVLPDRGERRDCLDQAWSRFLSACGLLPVLMPNVTSVALELCAQTNVAGLLLTGGNDLAAVGGDAPERDATENALLDMAEQQHLPVIGVCRGMQLLQQRSGAHYLQMMNAMVMLQAAATALIAVHKSKMTAMEYRQKEYLKAEKDGSRSRIFNREGSVPSFRSNVS